MTQSEPTDWLEALETWPWTFAKTMPHIPHWYVVRDRTVPAEEFDRFAGLIARAGYRGIWTSPGGHRRESLYLEIGDWKYWRIDVVINRDRVGSSFVEKVG